MHHRLALALVLVLPFLMLFPSEARAEKEEPFTWSAISFSAGMDYGNGPGVSAFGFGLNGRGGLTMDNGVYVGGVGEYFFGESERTSFDEKESYMWQWVAEGGYDLELHEAFVLRPKVGLGIASWTYHREANEQAIAAQTLDDTDPVITIGSQLLTPLKGLQLSGELRYNHFLGVRSAGSLVIGLSIGTRI